MSTAANDRASKPIWDRAWIWFLLVGVIGVPLVFVGLFLIGLVLANPITWFVGGAYVFWLGFIQYRNALMVRDTPTSRIQAAAIGLVEVSGRVSSSSPVTSGITRKPCVFWRATVEARPDKNRETIGQAQARSDYFEMEDETGRILVWPWDAKLIVTKSQQWRGAEALRIATSLPWVRQSVESLSNDARRTVVVTEERIEVNSTAYVMGTLSERHRVVKTENVGARLQERLVRPPKALAHAGRPHFFLLLRTIVYGARLTALSLAGIPTRLDRRQTSGFAEDPPQIDPQQVLIWRGNRNRPFIIADSAEALVIRALNKWSLLALAGGAAIMVGTVVYTLGEFR